MAERQTSSKSGIPSAGRSTKAEREEEKLAPEQELVFLQETLRRYQSAGGSVLVIPEFYDESGRRMVAILLPGVKYEAGDLQTIVAESK